MTTYETATTSESFFQELPSILEQYLRTKNTPPNEKQDEFVKIALGKASTSHIGHSYEFTRKDFE